jgi:hypothetical protein
MHKCNRTQNYFHSLKGDPKYIEERRALFKRSRRCCLLLEKGFIVRDSVAASDPNNNFFKPEKDPDLQTKLKFRHYEGSKLR